MSTITKALELLNYFRPIHLNWACLNSLVLPGVTKQPYTDICRPRTKRVHRKESSHITLQTGTGSFSTSNRRAPHASLLQGTKLVILARQMSQTYSAGAVVNEKNASTACKRVWPCGAHVFGRQTAPAKLCIVCTFHRPDSDNSTRP